MSTGSSQFDPFANFVANKGTLLKPMFETKIRKCFEFKILDKSKLYKLYNI